MRVPPENPTAPAANRGGGNENGLLAGETKNLDSESTAPPQDLSHRYHCNAQVRRPKTLVELRRGCEFTEMLDRRHPGLLAARRWR